MGTADYTYCVWWCKLQSLALILGYLNLGGAKNLEQTLQIKIEELYKKKREEEEAKKGKLLKSNKPQKEKPETREDLVWLPRQQVC